MKINRLIFYIAVVALIFSVTACNDPPEATPIITAAAVGITAPAANRPPDTSASGSGNFTVASVSWTPNDHTFMVYKTYTVSITLTANEGCFFADNLSASINGQTASVSGGGSTVTLSYAFAEIPDSANAVMNGTPEKPFKVYDVGTLRRVGADTANGWSLVVCYEQTADIVLPPVGAGGTNWTAIGSFSISAENSFRGTYDGGGHTISNLTINANSGWQGMFGYLANDGIVKNVGIINGSIKGGNNIGGLAGQNDSGTVQNCYFSGSVTGGDDAGGIAGQNNGTVQNCYSTGSVSGGYTGTVGGVVGSNSVSVQNCAALNDRVTTLHGSNSVGRIAGENNGTLANNYARSGMGIKYGSTGDDKNPVNNPGGVDGENISAGQYNSEAWWKDTGNWKTDGGAFAWDFVNIWKWDSTAGLPVLKK